MAAHASQLPKVIRCCWFEQTSGGGGSQSRRPGNNEGRAERSHLTEALTAPSPLVRRACLKAPALTEYVRANACVSCCLCHTTPAQSCPSFACGFQLASAVMLHQATCARSEHLPLQLCTCRTDSPNKMHNSLQTGLNTLVFESLIKGSHFFMHLCWESTAWRNVSSA